MAIAGPGDDAKIVVCGPRDGIAGLLAARLSAAGGIREVVLADETETLEQQVGSELPDIFRYSLSVLLLLVLLLLLMLLVVVVVVVSRGG